MWFSNLLPKTGANLARFGLQMLDVGQGTRRPPGEVNEAPVSNSGGNPSWFSRFGVYPLTTMIFRRNQQPAPERISLTATPYVYSSKSTKASNKILVVDDDPVILKALSIILEFNGYKVVTATDGSEAIGQMRQEHPDLLIVDVFLAMDAVGCGASGWDGFQLARWVRNLNCKAPVIIISGAKNPEYETQTIAAGAHGFLMKPIDNGLMLSTVASLLSGKKTPTQPITN